MVRGMSLSAIARLTAAYGTACTEADAAFKTYMDADAAAWKALETGGGEAHQAALPAVQGAHTAYQRVLWLRWSAQYALASYRVAARIATAADRLVRHPGPCPA